MGISIGFEQQDGTKQVRDDLPGWAFVESDAPLAWTLAWLNAAMPRVLRGRSVFAPCLIPPMRHTKYMNTRNEIRTTDDADTEAGEEGGGSAT
jgi:hypothetical protein